jgi:hypothetical protein
MLNIIILITIEYEVFYIKSMTSIIKKLLKKSLNDFIFSFRLAIFDFEDFELMNIINPLSFIYKYKILFIRLLKILLSKSIFL